MTAATEVPISQSPHHVPEPVLFNTWKHHASALRHRVAEFIREGEPGLTKLAAELVVIGAALMDLYVGDLSPAELARLAVLQLERDGRLSPEAFRAWVEGNGGYQMIAMPDGSEWVLRWSDEPGRHVHLHPGRWVANTLRVRANVLKTAVMAVACAAVRGLDPGELSVINQARTKYLGLAPVPKLREGDQSIAEVVALVSGK